MTNKKYPLLGQNRKAARVLAEDGVSIRPIWFKDNILFTLFLNSSSVCIPDAERFVVHSVKEALESGILPVPKDEVENLIHEEIAHSNVHDAYNDYLRRTGLSIDSHIQREQKTLNFLKRNFSLKTCLAFCTLTEHFTASMAKQVLDTGILEGGDIDERMDRVWVWHALEELDHRSTAFDIYLAAGGSYVRRFFAGILATVIFIYIQHCCFFSLLRQRGVLWNKSVWIKGWPYIFGKKGVYRHLIKAWFLYFKPGFHPTSIHVSNRLNKELHHYHIESELIGYFKNS